MSLILKQPITGPAAWRGSELAGDSSWLHPLSRESVAEIDAALALPDPFAGRAIAIYTTPPVPAFQPLSKTDRSPALGGFGVLPALALGDAGVPLPLLAEVLASIDVPLLGVLPPDPTLELPSRHLGLFPPHELPDL
mgnify:CR=1 FL=1